MKNESALGPDGLKAEMYKALIKTTKRLQTLTRRMKTELRASSEPSSWESSKTKMIPKVFFKITVFHKPTHTYAHQCGQINFQLWGMM